MNPFRKEYASGRKDQFDLDYAIFKKGVEKTGTREELVNYLEDNFQLVLTRMASQRAKDLMEELELY